MHTQGHLAPASVDEARDHHAALETPARTIVREIARAMGFDRTEYRNRVTDDVVATAQDAMFAALLEVTAGTRAEFDDYLTNHPDLEPTEQGHPNASRVVWHPAPFANRVVAATYNDSPNAAVSALRRRAYGELYRDAL